MSIRADGPRHTLKAVMGCLSSDMMRAVAENWRVINGIRRANLAMDIWEAFSKVTHDGERVYIQGQPSSSLPDVPLHASNSESSSCFRMTYHQITCHLDSHAYSPRLSQIHIIFPFTSPHRHTFPLHPRLDRFLVSLNDPAIYSLKRPLQRDRCERTGTVDP